MLRKKFVIVEDDVIGCEMLRRIVESHCGWYVIGVSHDGMAGIDMIVKHRPDVVMLDLMMPRCDGFTVMKKVREQRVDCKFFVLSSVQDREVMDSAVAAGAAYCMSKPYDKNAIIERIDGILRARETPRLHSTLFFVDPVEWEAAVDKEIFSRFMAFGVPSTQQGFCFLRSGIKLGLRDPAKLFAVGNFYPVIAARYHVSADAVERGMRLALDATWKRGDPQSFVRYIGNDTYLQVKPTNSEFLYLMASKIALDFRFVGADARCAR